MKVDNLIAIERYVLGCCILDQSLMLFAAEHLAPDSFSTAEHMFLFDVMHVLHCEALPIDFISVTDVAKARGENVSQNVRDLVMAVKTTAFLRGAVLTIAAAAPEAAA